MGDFIYRDDSGAGRVPQYRVDTDFNVDVEKIARLKAPDFNWNDDKIAQLRKLWADGLSTRLIAVQLRTTKYSVIGKAHRLDLPARPSPIRHGGMPKPVAAKRLGKRPSLPELKVSAAEIDAARPIVGSVPSGAPAEPAEPGYIVLADGYTIPKNLPYPRRLFMSELSAGRIRECVYPSGTPGRPDFDFCCEPAVPGRPYCPRHCAVCYEQRPSRTELESGL